jgi:ATP-binding cassette, subfamily B, bacterial PglK
MITKYIQKLRLLIDKKTKRYLLWLVAFSVFISVVETIGISAILPFIDIATNFDTIHSNKYYQWAFKFFGFNSSANGNVNFALAFGLILFGFYIFRGGINLLYIYAMANFSQHLYAQITKRLFKTYLTMPYQVFTNKNSSYMTKAIITEVLNISAIVNSILLVISEVLIIIFVYALMLITNWKITLIFTIIMAIKVVFLTQIISNKIKKVGIIRAEVQGAIYEIINRLFGNFRHVKLQEISRLKKNKNDFFIIVDKFAEISKTRIFLGSVPKLFLETGGFSLVVLLLVALLYLGQSNVAHIIPSLSLFVLALYRLLPSINRIVNGYNTLMYNHKSIDIIDNELNTTQEDLGNYTVEFNKKIELKDIDFSYQKQPTLTNINLTIGRGDKIAFVGESGSGKSTLVDLIVGLYQPNQGKIYVDSVLIDKSNLQNWRSQIGYIPQQSYLFDGTISENVCFGRKIDKILLERVLKQAHIFDFLQTKKGVETLVGEGGVQLSGGQKQRITIARALYGQPEILVLDEATSALDDEIEKKIMNEIYQISHDKTLIIIAHRLSTIKGCDKVYKVENGKVF